MTVIILTQKSLYHTKFGAIGIETMTFMYASTVSPYWYVEVNESTEKENKNSKIKMLCELLLTSAILIAYSIYRLSTNSAKYFEERNLKYVGAKSLPKGLLTILLAKADIFSIIKRMYDAIPDVP